MQKITYDSLIEKIPNKYILTIVCGERAREIIKGEEPLTKYTKKDNYVKKVFREVLDGKITYEEVE